MRPAIVRVYREIEQNLQMVAFCAGRIIKNGGSNMLSIRLDPEDEDVENHVDNIQRDDQIVVDVGTTRYDGVVSARSGEVIKVKEVTSQCNTKKSKKS